MAEKRSFKLEATNLSAPEQQRMTENLAHWESQASAHGVDPDASWGDANAIELEIRALIKYIEPGTQLLDAGCANGFTTFRMLERNPAAVHAFDFSERMVEAAKRAATTRDPESKIHFYHANILEIPEPKDSVDLAYAVRVLINLPTWERQQQAVAEMHRILKPGGRYVLIEGFSGSMAKLNALRELAGLPAIQPPSFNLWIDEPKLEACVRERFEVEHIDRFTSVYYVATRFLRDLTLRGDEPPSYSSALHDLARELPFTARSGDFGGIKAYVLRKR